MAKQTMPSRGSVTFLTKNANRGFRIKRRNENTRVVNVVVRAPTTTTTTTKGPSGSTAPSHPS